MDRINGANTIDIGGGKRGWRVQNKAAGISGTEMTAEFFNAVQEEIMAVIAAAGIVPNHAVWTQLRDAISALITAALPSLAPYARKDLSAETVAGGFLQWIAATAGTGNMWLQLVRQSTGSDRSCRLSVNAVDGSLLQEINFPTDLTAMYFRSKAGSGGSYLTQATIDCVNGDINTIASGGVNFTTWVKSRLLPVGAYVPWSGDTGNIPAGYIQANGALISRTSYAALFSFAQAEGFVVEATWSAGYQGRYSNGDLATTFRVPDLRGTSIIARSGTAPDWGVRTADDVKAVTGATYRNTTAITWLIKAYNVA